MITLAIILVAAMALPTFFLGLFPLFTGREGKLYIEGRFGGLVWLAWTGFKFWAILKLGDWA